MNILIVEDEIDLGAVVRDYLSSNDFNCTLVHDADSGLEKIQNETWDLILLDVMMPGMDGPETLHALRKLPELANTPVVFMTAKVQPQEVDGYLTLGAVGVIAKPFDPMTLADQLREIWAKVVREREGV